MLWIREFEEVDGGDGGQDLEEEDAFTLVVGSARGAQLIGDARGALSSYSA